MLCDTRIKQANQSIREGEQGETEGIQTFDHNAANIEQVMRCMRKAVGFPMIIPARSASVYPTSDQEGVQRAWRDSLGNEFELKMQRHFLPTDSHYAR